jgi:hypothetical protein
VEQNETLPTNLSGEGLSKKNLSEEPSSKEDLSEEA